MLPPPLGRGTAATAAFTAGNPLSFFVAGGDAYTSGEGLVAAPILTGDAAVPPARLAFALFSVPSSISSLATSAATMFHRANARSGIPCLRSFSLGSTSSAKKCIFLNHFGCVCWWRLWRFPCLVAEFRFQGRPLGNSPPKSSSDSSQDISSSLDGCTSSLEEHSPLIAIAFMHAGRGCVEARVVS